MPKQKTTERFSFINIKQHAITSKVTTTILTPTPETLWVITEIRKDTNDTGETSLTALSQTVDMMIETVQN